MDSGAYWRVLPAVAAAVLSPAYATTYLTVEQAQAVLFPSTRLTPAPMTLNDAQRRAIEARGGVRVRDRELKAWRGEDGGWFLIDQVLGKHELITYAVGLSADGRVTSVEIMDYRETYGYQIRDAAWRRQFIGKTAADPLKLDDDIRNVSGATLSCRHVADGIKRLLATYEVVLKQ